MLRVKLMARDTQLVSNGNDIRRYYFLDVRFSGRTCQCKLSHNYKDVIT